MRVLVTGGAGFVGSNLCEFLLNKNHEVVCLDNLFSCRFREEDGERIPVNVESLLQNPLFHFVNHDVREPFNILPVDRIYHLACPASPPHYQKDKVMTVLTNVQGSINALELARRQKARILLSSTSEVYGDPEVHPQVESYRGNVNTQGPRACYDEGKRLAETLFHDYHHEQNVDVRIARIFNTYGPNMDPIDGRVVSNFIVQALNNEDITVYGNGEQTRSFQYITDLVQGLYNLMECESSDGWFGPVNIGNPCEFTIRELAEKVIAKTQASSQIVQMPLPADDPCRRKPNIDLAKERLNWEPKISLDEGLDETIRYFRSITN